MSPDGAPAPGREQLERSAGVDRVWSPGRRLLTAGLVLTVTVVATEALAVATVLPLVEDDLGGLQLYGWVFAGFFLGNLVGIVVTGRAADRVPLVVPFLAGLLLFSVGLGVAGLAPSMPVLVLGRVLQGLGAGALPAAAYVTIGRAYPAGARPRMFALLSTAWVVPGLLAPSLAGVVGEQAGWRWVFLGVLPVTVAAGGLAARAVLTVPPPPAPDGAPGSVLAAVGLAAAAGALMAGLGAGELGLAAALVIAGAVGGALALRRLTPPGTLRAAPGLPAAVALRGLLTFSFFAADAYLPLTVTGIRGAPTLLTGAALTAGTLAWAAGSWIQERQVGRLGPQVLVRRGLVILAVGVGSLVLVTVPAVPAATAVVLAGVAGLGIGQAYAPLSLSVLASAPPGGQGAATAALQVSDVLGVALGTGAAGALVAFGDTAGWPEGRAVGLVFCLAAAVGLGAAALAGRLPRTVVADEHGP